MPRRCSTRGPALAGRAPGGVRQPERGRALLRRAAGRRRLAGGCCAAARRARAPAQALRDAGVPAAAIVEPAADAPQFDSEALWAQLRARDWRGRSVLVVRGDGGRDWLAERLREAGAPVDAVAAYRAPRAAALDAASGALLDAASPRRRRTLWLFSSSEAIAHLGALMAPATDWSRARALATHPRIARARAQARLRRVFEAQPGLDAVVACIQSMQP